MSCFVILILDTILCSALGTGNLDITCGWKNQIIRDILSYLITLFVEVRTLNCGIQSFILLKPIVLQCLKNATLVMTITFALVEDNTQT